MRAEAGTVLEQLVEADAAVVLLEHRFFAVLDATRSLQMECQTLGEVVKLAAAQWHRSRLQLSQLEALRDALDAQLAAAQIGSRTAA